jgi:8-oxo-dGTP pyrophosphatase MutT (NUDIX family)
VTGLAQAAAPPSPDAPLERLEPWFAARLRPLAAGWGDVEGAGRAADDFPMPDSFTHAAVLVGLTLREGGWSLILTRRADSLTRHSGQVALPGGRAEPGETPADTALREAHEEIGLEPRFVRPIGLGDAYRTGTGFEITPLVAFVEPGFTLVPSAAEVAEVFETPFAFVMDAANHDLRTWDGPGGVRRRYYAMVHGERTIWGATAGVLRALYQRLFAP